MKDYLVTSKNCIGKEFVRKAYRTLKIAERYFNVKSDLHIYEREIHYIFDENCIPLKKTIKTTCVR